MYFGQHWFTLADRACEEALLDSTALRRSSGIDLGREPAPDGTTLLRTVCKTRLVAPLAPDSDCGKS